MLELLHQELAVGPHHLVVLSVNDLSCRTSLGVPFEHGTQCAATPRGRRSLIGRSLRVVFQVLATPLVKRCDTLWAQPLQELTVL